MISYTYLIGWSTSNKWYYGAQYGKCAHPSNLWTTYFTSSKVVAEYRAKHGEPDIVLIHKQFRQGEAARVYERHVLVAVDARNNVLLLNQTNGDAHTYSKRGIPLSEEHKEKLRAAKVGRPISEETRAKRLGRKLSDATKQKMSQTRKGRAFSPEHKAAMQGRQNTLGRSYYTDGVTNKLLLNTAEIPAGFRPGRTLAKRAQH